MIKYLFTILLVLSALAVTAQLVVPGSTVLKSGANTPIAVNGNIQFTSANIDLAERGVSLFLVGTDQTLTSNSPLSIPSISTVSGGAKSIQGKITVTSQLALGGSLTTTNTLSQNVLTIGQAASISGFGDNSYIIGALVYEGTGDKFFPIGTASQYMPITLFGITGTSTTSVAVLGTGQSGATTPGTLPESVDAVSSNWVWRYISSGLATAVPQLPVLAEDAALIQGADIQGVVINLDDATQIATNLGGVLGDNVISAGLPINDMDGSLMIGSSVIVTPLIRNLITLNNDSENDFLVIEEIDIYPANEVVLLDRWGTEVYRKSGFQNFDDINNPYDGSLDFLEPGNYICLVKYAGRMTKQVVTVLK